MRKGETVALPTTKPLARKRTAVIVPLASEAVAARLTIDPAPTVVPVKGLVIAIEGAELPVIMRVTGADTAVSPALFVAEADNT